MITVKINKREYWIKNEWKDLSIKDFQAVFAIRAQGEKPSIFHKLGILLQLSNLTKRLIKVFTPDQAHRLLNLVRFAWDAELDYRPFSYFVANGVRFYLPDTGYANTSAGEVAMFNIYNLEFLKTEDEQKKEALFYLIIAQLCRPERKDLKAFKADVTGWNGDTREPYNSARADEYAEQIKKGANLPGLMAVYAWLMKMNNDFLKRNEGLFVAGDGVPVFSGGEGWIALLEDVAGMGKFGDFDKVFDMNGPSLFLHVRMAQKRAVAMDKG